MIGIIGFFHNAWKQNPFVMGKDKFWKTLASETAGKVSPADGATAIVRATKQAANDLVVKSGAFQEAEGEKISSKTIAFIAASILVGLASPKLYSYAIEQGYTGLIGALIFVVFVLANATD